MKIDDFLDSPNPNNKRAGAVRIDDFLGADPAPIPSPMGDELFDPITGVQYAGSKPTRPVKTGSVLDGTTLTPEQMAAPVDQTRSIPNLKTQNQPRMQEMREWVPPQPRGFLRAISDAALGVYQGGAGMVKGVADNVNAGDNVVSNFLETAIAGADRLKSDDMRNQQAIRNMEIYAARKNAGEVGAARAAFRSAFDYPAAGIDVVARGTGSLAPTIGLSLAGAGAKTMGAVNMLSNAGDAASQTADQLRALPALVWATDPQYQELVSQGMSHAEAVAFLAPIKAIPAQAVGAATGAISGATGVEKVLAGKAVGNTIRNRLGRAGTEILTEQGETLAPMVTGNVTVGNIDGTTTPMQGTGQAVVDTALGTLLGAALSARRVPTPAVAPAPTPTPAVTPGVEPSATPSAVAPAATQEAPSAPAVNTLIDLIRDTAVQPSKLQTETPSVDAFLDGETPSAISETITPITDTQAAQTETPAPNTETPAAPVIADDLRAAIAEGIDQIATQTAQINPLDQISTAIEQTSTPSAIDAPSASTQAAELTTAQKAQAQIPQQIQAPAFIDGNRAQQITNPQPGMRPGDIVGAKGAPFKNKSSAQKVAKEAGPGWRIARSNGGFVVRWQPASEKQIANAKRQVKEQRSIDTERDSMFAAIAKLGGVSREQLIKEWGADPADLKNLYGAGIMRVATAKGMPLDSMAESLAEAGYLSLDENGKHDVGEFEELFFNELSGSKHYTPEGWVKQAQIEDAARYEDYLSEQDAKAAGLDQASEQDQEDTSEQLDEFQELTEDDYAKLEQEAIAWEQSATEQDNIPDNADDTIDASGGRLDQTNERIEENAGGEGQGDTNTDQARQDARSEQGAVREEGAGSQGATQEGFQLEGETEREIREREEREDARRKADEQKEREAQNRAQADAERDDFALTGSDRTADVASSRGQTGLFEQSQTPTQIKDFGEKIGGAKKDVWTSFKDQLNEVSDDDIANQPLSKIWPAPDYQALLDSGVDPWVVAFTRASRDEIPAKPRQPYKVKRWAEQVKTLREMASDMMDDQSAARVKALMNQMDSMGMRKLASRIELYQEVGHKHSLQGVSFAHHHYSIYKGRENVSLWTIEQNAKATGWSNWPRELATGETKADMLANFKSRYDSLNINEKASKQVSFDIYSRTKVDGYFVGKKVGRNYIDLAGPFATVKEARDHKANNQAELEAKLAKSKEIPSERRDTNNPRVGEDMRNGQDVTPFMFSEAFGFRGVEFGNWVEQSKRQKDLNEAYDALMDMAAVIGVPPKALSLNGELSIAFGARGSGGTNSAAAHYESAKVVINLTKKSGAGSLGHEWWHAVDNYFSRMRGNKADMMTEALDVSLASRDSDYQHKGEVRKQMIDAFGSVVKAIKSTAIKARSAKLDSKRSKDYWTTTPEMSARAFESYLISKLQDQDASNDYLANIVDEKTWSAAEKLGFELEGSYPYPTAGEIPQIRAGFDEFFDTIETKETEKGIAIFRSQEAASPESKWLSEAQIAQLIEERIGKFAHQPPIFILDSVRDIFPDVDANVVGVVSSGRIFLFREGIGGSRSEAIRTLWHELLHYGIRRFMTKEQYIAAMKKLYAADAWVKQSADAWTKTELGQQIAQSRGNDYAIARGVDEALADLAEETQGNLDQSIKARVTRAIQRWVAFLADRFGFPEMAAKWRGYSNEEASALIRDIYGKLREDAPAADGNSGFTADPAFSMREDEDAQQTIDLPKPGRRFEPIEVKDFVSVEQSATGRRQYVAGRKLYDRLSTYATDYLGKLKLSDNKPDAFKEMMRQFKVDQFKAAQNAKQIAETGKALSPEQREMISDILEKQMRVGDVPPQEMADLAASMAAALDVQSRELVDLGMITEDGLVKNYLPRLYQHGLAAKLTNPALMQAWFTKARMKIRGDRLKSRGMFAEISPDKVAQAKKLGWKVASMPDGSEIPQDLFDAFDKSQPIPPNYRDAKVLMWRDYTESERQEMGEIRDGVLRYAMGYVETQKDVAIGRLFKAIAQNPELAKTFNPGGWVQVPMTEINVRPGVGVKAYGALAGMFVEPQVADALKRNTQPKGVLMAMYDKALSFWKEGKTVWNPVSHGNNVVSNLFTVYFAGINPASPARWRETIREFRTRGKYWNEAVDSGLFGNEFANQEIQDLLMPDFSDMADIESVAASRLAKVIEFSKKYPGRPISWYRENMQKAYEFEDQFFKLMLFIDRRKAGMSPNDAITDAERYVFNYSDMPEGVELIKRTYSPFFAYTYKAIPMVLHTAMTRPDRLLVPIALLGGANWLAYMILGADEEKERKGMPEYMQGRTVIGTPKAVRMPFNVEGKPAFMDMSRRVPLGDLFDMNNQTNGLPVPAPFMPSHPALTAMQAVLYNQDTFTGKDLVKKSDTSWEAAQARAGYLYRQFTPNAPFIPGSYNFNKLADATAYTFDTEIGPYTGRTKSGDPIPMATTLPDVLTGTKIRAFDPERGVDYQRAAIAREEKELRANMRSADRNQSMTEDSRERYNQRQREKIDELRKRKQELQD